MADPTGVRQLLVLDFSIVTSSSFLGLGFFDSDCVKPFQVKRREWEEEEC